MKNQILTFALVTVFMLTIVGCGGREMKEIDGLVTSVEIDNDTLKSAKVIANGDSLLFNLADTRFVNGMMVHGDSVHINYIEGQGDSLRALLVSVYPKTPHYLDPKAVKNDTLRTAPSKRMHKSE